MRAAARGFGIAALTLLGACTEGELATGGGGSASAAARLPQQAAGFVRGGSVDHERENPGFGTSVNYATPNRAAVATVSLYTKGRSTEPSSSDIETEFRAAVQEASDTTVAGRSARRFQGGQPMTLSDGLRCMRLQGNFGRTPVQRLVCVGSAAGRFIRIQVTQPGAGVAGADANAFATAAVRAARGR